MERLRRRLEDDGLVVVEDVLAPPQVESLVDAVDGVYADRTGPLHLLGFLGLDERFLDLVDHPVALELVTALLGWNVYVYHCHLDVHPPLDEPPRWRWHQDGERQNADLEAPRPRLSLKVAWFLTDVSSPEDGALWTIPGSHRDESLAPSRNGSTPSGAEPLLVRAGTAVVFDRRLWHARGDNTARRTRKVLFLAYAHRWIRPRDDLGIDLGALNGADPVRRQLLGAGTSLLGHWLPTDEDVPLRMR